MVSTEDILRKYSAQIESKLNQDTKKDYSKEYEQFKKDMQIVPTKYEAWAKTLGNLISIKIAENIKFN